jgi:alginate O-acetyltransferase complex protein AlgI
MEEILERIFLYSADQPLLFTQFYFWGFFIVCMFLYSFFYKEIIWRNLYLLVISLFFYYKAGGHFLLLLIFETAVNYWLADQIHKNSKQIVRKYYLIGSVVFNLGILAYFKYTFFFTDTINSIFGTHFVAQDLLAKATNSIFGSNYEIAKIILPVGISFHTFQALSYLIDIYRKSIKPVRNIIDFGFFVSFFPQIVAGPIVRATTFIPQLSLPYNLSREDFGRAVFWIITGLFKKVFISDYISINFVDRIFDNPGFYTGFENLMAVYGYAIQIYCDFSGYTDIAIGIALLMGFHLPPNFNLPYKAQNITDFWRRWHISLSTWLKDYLYIALGGNRKGKVRTYINLLLTMLLGGLWHGASLRFIIWGGMHGLGLAFHKIWIKYVPIAQSKSKLYNILALVVTFHFVCAAWIFFRANDMNGVRMVFSQIFSNFGFDVITNIIASYSTVFLVILLGFALHWLPDSVHLQAENRFIFLPAYAKVAVTVLVIFVLYQVKSSGLQPFIYFQF